MVNLVCCFCGSSKLMEVVKKKKGVHVSLKCYDCGKSQMRLKNEKE